MERLHSPWRSAYIDSFTRTGKPEKEEGPCILCTAHQQNADDEHLIVTRGTHAYVILNRYPYNSGHLMIVPFRHIPSLVDLNPMESAEVMGLVRQMMQSLTAVSSPDGFNVGSNIGRTAGAGIDSHVHVHVVPRWNGDTNFMPVLGDTKVISEDMKATLRKLRAAL